MSNKISSFCLLAGLLGLLAACAPQNTETIRVRNEVNQVGFYPNQTGIIYEYLPEDAPLDAQRVIQRIEGPRTVSGELLTLSRTIGRGFDLSSYRIYNDQGVFLRREDGPGYSMTLSPALQEYPPAQELRVGKVWQGRSNVKVLYPETSSRSNISSFTTEYTYTVVDKRTISLERGEERLGSFEVYVLNLEGEQINAAGTVLQRVEKEIWFSPYIGEVLTSEGGLLIASNLGIGTLVFGGE